VEAAVSLSKTERDALHAAQRTVRRLKSRERKTAKAARPVSPKANRGRVRDPGFLAYVRRLPCAVGPIGCAGGIEAAHIRYSLPGEPLTGMQRKPDDCRAVPLCAGHHRTNPDAQHAGSERAFWAKRGIDPHAIAASRYAQYLGSDQ
jgi:hypothetical protein